MIINLWRRLLSEFLNWRNKHLQPALITDEYERYCKSERVYGFTSALAWWLEETQQKNYPYLSKMAVDILSIPAMSAEPERLFSGAKITITDRRNRLGSDVIQALECLKVTIFQQRRLNNEGHVGYTGYIVLLAIYWVTGNTIQYGPMPYCAIQYAPLDNTIILRGVHIANILVVTKSRRSQYFGIEENRESATAVEAISADGRYIPAFLILSGKVHLEQWYGIKELDGDTLIGVTETGFTNDQLNLAWIQHFDKHAKSKGAWRLLLLDGHGSHHTLDLIEYAEAHNIVLFALPPHLTHLLQPLDVVVFQPYKHYHSRAVDFAIRSGASKITKLEFLAMIQSIRVKAFKESTILSAFKNRNPPIQSKANPRETQREGTGPDAADRATCRAVFIPFGTPYRTEFDPIDDIEKEVFVHNLQRYVKGAISQGHELKQTMVDLYNTKLAEQQRQGRKKYKNRHLQSGGVLTIDEGRAIAKSKEDIRIAKAEKLVLAKQKREKRAIELEERRQPGRLRKPKKKPNDQLYKLQSQVVRTHFTWVCGTSSCLLLFCTRPSEPATKGALLGRDPEKGFLAHVAGTHEDFLTTYAWVEPITQEVPRSP
ncbi:DDE superfamily endonuclease [Hirsutella rhossiliensis]